MARRRRAEKRKTVPDEKYGSIILTKFINKVMRDGKKAVAKKVVYGALEKFASNVKSENALEAFEQALENAKPTLEVKSRRIGGATYQVPVEIPENRRVSMGMKWIIGYARDKVGRNMTDGLSQELTDCFNSQGSSVKKKDDTHRMAEANKAFAHFKW